MVAYILSGRTFCWNSRIPTSNDVDVTLLPTKVVNGSTNCGIVELVRGVCGSVAEANVRQAAVGMNIPAPATAPSLRNVRRDGICVILLSTIHAMRDCSIRCP